MLSPNLPTEGLMLSCVIDTTKGRYVETSVIPVSFLQTDQDRGGIYIKMDWEMVTLIKENSLAYYKGSIYKGSC